VQEATRLLWVSKAYGPLSKSKREELEAVIKSNHRREALTEEHMLQVARLSVRQLRRLSKSRLIESDKQILKALEALKSQSRAFSRT